MARFRVAAEAPAGRLGTVAEEHDRRLFLPDPERPQFAGDPGGNLRRRSLAALAVAPVLQDRGPLAATRPRFLRGRAWLGTAHQGGGYRCGLRRSLGNREEAGSEAVRHVRARFAQA